MPVNATYRKYIAINLQYNTIPVLLPIRESLNSSRNSLVTVKRCNCNVSLAVTISIDMCIVQGVYQLAV